MTVSKTDYGYWHTLEGTLIEVAGALKTNVVHPSNIISCIYDTGASAWVCIYYKGS
jgi:hypothetical protein